MAAGSFPPRLVLPPSHGVLALIALAFVAPGLVGHDPWRAFDVLAIEVAHQMHLSGDWIVPRLAGAPYPEDPPFFHWLALASGKALGWALGFHNAARLASGAAVLAALWFLYLAARHFSPLTIQSGLADPKPARQAAGTAAALLTIGSLGLIVHAHEAVPDLATLAACCAALLFLSQAARRPVKSGLAFGASLGVAFLSTGLMAPLVFALVAVLSHLVCREWRTAQAPRFLAAAAAVFLVLALSWPLALWLRAPEVARDWWYIATHARGGFLENLRYYATVASWYTWPAWPLAALSAWILRREWRAPIVFVPASAALLGLAAISWVGPQQDINATILIAPLALLGAQGVARLQRGAANALDWFGVMTFTFFAGLVWLAYIALHTGVPPKIAANFLRAAPGFVPEFHWLPFLAALALTVGWLYLVFFTAPSATRGVTRWAAGVALLWGCFATLGLPWADHLKSYRGVALQLRSVLPAGASCIAQSGVGLPQRAAFSYHAGLRTVARQSPLPGAPGKGDCPLLLVQGHPRQEIAPGAGWRKLADVGRPGDRGERYRLYRYEKTR